MRMNSKALNIDNNWFLIFFFFGKIVIISKNSFREWDVSDRTSIIKFATIISFGFLSLRLLDLASISVSPLGVNLTAGYKCNYWDEWLNPSFSLTGI